MRYLYERKVWIIISGNIKRSGKSQRFKGSVNVAETGTDRTDVQEDQLENEENNKKAEKKEPDKKAEEEEHKKAENESSQSHVAAENVQLDSGEKANGILEVLPDGYGLSDAKIICPVKTIFMYRLLRSADLI